MNDKPACPRCHAPLPPGTPPESCPRCLMSLGAASEGAGDRPTVTSHGGAHPPAPEPAELAPHFPQLEILELLGRGGMGIVYKARQKSLDRPVALKIISVSREASEGFAERFTREAKALASLDHPSIVTVHDFGVAGGHCYLLMEFVEGANLRQEMRSGRIAPRRALEVVSQVCEALQFAHDAGIVHRDIKPENILIDAKGRVKIADFGLAKMLGIAPDERRLTDSRQRMGTAHYMAPEQVERPRDVDQRADIYSLGVVFYELLTGELPLGRFDPPSRRVEVDVRVDDVVLRALEKEPRRRYQAAREVKTDVDRISDHPHEGRKPAPEFVPPADALSPARLRLAGWVCIVDAVLQVPLAAMMALSLIEPDLASQVSWIVVSFISVALFVFIFWNLRRMLAEHFGYSRASPTILLLIVFNVGWFVLGAVSYPGSSLELAAFLFTIVVLLVTGLGYIALGILLHLMKQPLEALRKPLAWVAIATGILTASVVFVVVLPVALLGYMAFDVLLALVFFRVAQRGGAVA